MRRKWSGSRAICSSATSLRAANLRTADGEQVDLRNIRSPIIVFCSWGDNITPPQQALGWITDIYGTIGSRRDRPDDRLFGTPMSPGTGWTPFSVKLTAAAGWRWNWNARATQEQIRSVLANPTSLEIRGEYHTGPDEGALDDVVLRSGG